MEPLNLVFKNDAPDMYYLVYIILGANKIVANINLLKLQSLEKLEKTEKHFYTY